MTADLPGSPEACAPDSPFLGPLTRDARVGRDVEHHVAIADGERAGRSTVSFVRNGQERTSRPGSAGQGRTGRVGAELPRPGRPVVVGVLNVTPDSFSDGGRYLDRADAVAHAVAMVAEGADLVDVGGESTRPGADRVDAATEKSRVLPVIRELAAAGVPMSIDTTRAEVAEAALEAGAVIVNDVSGGLADPAMNKVVATANCPYVLMHWRGHSKRMQDLARYTDVVSEVRDELAGRVDAAVAAGVPAEKIVIDPGLGFAKTAAHNWQLLARLDELQGLGLPVLVATSRKSFLGALLAGPDGTPRPVAGREAATLATTVLAVAAGVWGVRVHEVQSNVDAIAVWSAYRAARTVGPGQPGRTGADR